MKLDRIAQWAEVLANVGVLVSVVFLVLQIQENTQILRIQAAERRAAALNTPLITNPQLPEILSKIKAVDGAEPHVKAFMDRYELTYVEAVVWMRYLGDLWSGLNAEYAQLGPSKELAHRIEQLLAFPDETLWLDTDAAAWFLSDDFQAYLASIREAS